MYHCKNFYNRFLSEFFCVSNNIQKKRHTHNHLALPMPGDFSAAVVTKLNDNFLKLPVKKNSNIFVKQGDKSATVADLTKFQLIDCKAKASEFSLGYYSLSLNPLHKRILSSNFVVKICLRFFDIFNILRCLLAFFLKILRSFIDCAKDLLPKLNNFFWKNCELMSIALWKKYSLFLDIKLCCLRSYMPIARVLGKLQKKFNIFLEKYFFDKIKIDIKIIWRSYAILTNK